MAVMAVGSFLKDKDSNSSQEKKYTK